MTEVLAKIGNPASEKLPWPGPANLASLAEMWLQACSLWVGAVQDGTEWKRKEFAHTAIRRFLDDANIRNAMLMMDWRERILVLSDEQATFLGEKKLAYHEDALPTALSVKESFSLEETVIRDCFDAFFTEIERFIGLIETDVMKHHDFKPYFGYWAELLRGKIAHKNPASLAAIESYIAEYFDRAKIEVFLNAVGET
jgi:hypothetical protein